MINLIRLDIMARWVRSANRETTRRIARAPLFAWGGLVAASTPEVQRAKAEACSEGIAAITGPETAARHMARAAELRALVATVATPEELVAAEVCLRWIGRMPVMVADHWWGEARKRGLVPPHPAIVAADALMATRARMPVASLVQLGLFGVEGERR